MPDNTHRDYASRLENLTLAALKAADVMKAVEATMEGPKSSRDMLHDARNNLTKQIALCHLNIDEIIENLCKREDVIMMFGGLQPTGGMHSHNDDAYVNIPVPAGSNQAAMERLETTLSKFAAQVANAANASEGLEDLEFGSWCPQDTEPTYYNSKGEMLEEPFDQDSDPTETIQVSILRYGY